MKFNIVKLIDAIDVWCAWEQLEMVLNPKEAYSISRKLRM